MNYVNETFLDARELAVGVTRPDVGRTILTFGNGDIGAYVGRRLVAYWTDDRNMPLQSSEVFRIAEKLQSRKGRICPLKMAIAIDEWY